MKRLAEMGSVEIVREGGQHTIVSVNGNRVVIPRHREINELTAKGILGTPQGGRTEMGTTYTARARRSDNWWALDVPELPGVHTQARRLDQAEAMVRDAISLMLDVAPESFNVVVEPELEGDAEKVVHELAEARAEADRAHHRLTAAMLTSAAVLTHECDLTMRDAGVVMGVSFQRVAQLVHTVDNVQDLLAGKDALEDELGHFGTGLSGSAAPSSARR